MRPHLWRSWPPPLYGELFGFGVEVLDLEPDAFDVGAMLAAYRWVARQSPGGGQDAGADPRGAPRAGNR